MLKTLLPWADQLRLEAGLGLHQPSDGASLQGQVQVTLPSIVSLLVFPLCQTEEVLQDPPHSCRPLVLSVESLQSIPQHHVHFDCTHKVVVGCRWGRRAQEWYKLLLERTSVVGAWRERMGSDLRDLSESCVGEPHHQGWRERIHDFGRWDTLLTVV